MSEIGYGELVRARSSVLKQANRLAPGKLSLDTSAPMVKLGLVVVEFQPVGTLEFAKNVASKNLHRISIAKGNYAVSLFAAAIASGIVYGSAAEQRRGR